MNIVLAEDQAPAARVMKLALERAGFSVDVRGNGLEALHAIRERAPDALITDIEMPQMDGQALCETLQTEMPERTFPIFVITSVTDLVHRKWTKNIANLHFLEKPVSIRRLTTELKAKGVG